MSYSPSAQRRYNEKNYTIYALKLHKEKDAEIIAAIDALTATGLSRQAVIKQLIMRGAEK